MLKLPGIVGRDGCFMRSSRDFIEGPWRAVPVLGVTQILSWGTIFYTPVLIVPLIAAERGWSISFTIGGFSVGLLVSRAGRALCRPFDRSLRRTCRHDDRFTDRRSRSLSDRTCRPAGRLLRRVDGAWCRHGGKLVRFSIATLGRIFGLSARRPITALTLAGGFASTVSWPATHFLIERVGWSGTYLVYALLLACVAAPLHAFALPRSRFEADVPTLDGQEQPAKVLPPHGLTFILVASAFASYAFVPSGLSAHLLAIFTRTGIDAGTVVWIGALFGSAQVARGSLNDLRSDRIRGWLTFCAQRIAVRLPSTLVFLRYIGWHGAAFALMFGGANGLVTITRGAVPLALFGASGYGRLMGRLAGPFLLVQLAAPLVMAFVVERTSDAAALALAAALASIALHCFVSIRRPA